MLRKLLVLSIVVAVGGGAATSTAHAEPSKKKCIGIHQGINFYRNATHNWQRKLGHPLTKSSKAKIAGCDYAAWVADLWRKRAAKWKSRYESYVARYAQFDRANTSIWRAIEFIAPISGIASSRLHYRVSVEGGHGGWVPNKNGSGAGGWFQFMEGTFYDYSTTALQKFGIPMKFNSWYSPLGQAATAAYMFRNGLECANVGWAASC